MHELSIARAVVKEITLALADRPDAVVTVVRVRVGALSGIVPAALTYGFEFARAGTIAEDANLLVDRVPVRIFCDPCDREQESGDGVVCPTCQTPSADILAGRELIITSIDVDEQPDEATTIVGQPDEATTIVGKPDEATTIVGQPDEATRSAA